MESLQKRTPCVIIGRSGQWADILADLCETKETDVTEETIKNLLHSQLTFTSSLYNDRKG